MKGAQAGKKMMLDPNYIDKLYTKTWKASTATSSAGTYRP